MTTPNTPPWSRPTAAAGAPRAADHWESTRVQTVLATQIAGYEEAAPPQADIGRQVGPDERELFVSCDPAQALQQQFEHVQPEFIAVHDIGTTSSRKLLAGIATASKRPLQKLTIRRQGFGTTLATLEFVELTSANGGVPLRMYTTQTEADTVARRELAHMLLAYSRLGVVMVGDLPPHALAAALAPLREQMDSGPWPNRQLLLLPLVSASALATQGTELGRGTGVTVRSTPQVTRPAEAWAFISGTWSRLSVSRPGSRPAAAPATTSPPTLADRAAPPPAPQPPPTPQHAPSVARIEPPADTGIESVQGPLVLRPMPEVPQPRGAAEPTASKGSDPLLDRYVAQLAKLTGMVTCCVFDPADRQPLAHAGAAPGTAPGPAELARHGAALLASLLDANRALRLGPVAAPDAAITFGSHHVVLRSVPTRPNLVLHALLDKESIHITLARMQIARLDELFEPDNRPPA